MRAPDKIRQRPRDIAATTPLPLATLLSFVLVAFTIEFDNETERCLRHRTTNHGSPGESPRGPWLVSLAMWSNCMQFVGEDGINIGELEALARTKTNLNGMERWGYITIEPNPADRRSKSSARKAGPIRKDSLIRATRAGRVAQRIWQPMFREIENRWGDRFSKTVIQELRESLWGLVSKFEFDLPDCLPILGYGLYSEGPNHKRRPPIEGDCPDPSSMALPALLSKVLLAFALEFEQERGLSLAISANIIRVLDERGVPVRDLPRLTGVSKEAIKTAAGVLQKSDYIAVYPDPAAPRVKVVKLTAKGTAAQKAYREKVGAIESRWAERFGNAAIHRLRKALEDLARDPGDRRSPLFQGLEPYPRGWRASVPKPQTLPHYPMVLHRGGYPDGS